MKIAIVGSREPSAAQRRFARIATLLALNYGFDVSTGAAKGIDNIAMDLAKDKALVYLPWSGYNSDLIPSDAKTVVYNPEIHNKWTKSVHKLHPSGDNLKQGAFKLHARNFGIIEGASLVIAFPSDKPGGGGTGQGIRISEYLKVPLITIPPNYETKYVRSLEKLFCEKLNIDYSPLQVYTSRISYDGDDGLNITVKSANLEDRAFAPTWDIVMGHKNGKITDQEYTDEYYRMMRMSYICNTSRWDELLCQERVVLLCYCPPTAFCHRKLLADILVSLGALYMGEV